jgi:putative nucleotidyltransferase with HDIG domain
VGQPSDQRFKAPVTVEDKIATENNRQAAKDAADRLEPRIMRDEAALGELNEHLDAFFEEAAVLRRNQVEIFTPYTDSSLTNPDIGAYPTQQPQEQTLPLEETTIQTPGNVVPSDEIITPAPEPTPPPPEPTPSPTVRMPGLTESATATLLSMETERYNALVDAIYSVSEIILENGVSDLDARTLLSVKDEMDKLDFNSDARSLGYDIITLYLRQNIHVDEDATAQDRAEREARYDPVFFLQGETIVDDGQIVTEEMYAVLDELGLIHTGHAEHIIRIIGAAIMIAALFVIAAMYMYFFPDREIGIKETAVTFTLYSILAVSAWALVDVPIQLLPLTVFVILIAAFLGVRTALVLNIGAVAACFMIVGADIEFLMYYTVSGSAVALFAGRTTDRSRIFISALLTSLVNLSLYAGVTLLTRNAYSTEMLLDSAFAAMAGMLSVIISFGSIPVWEAAFGLVTPIKLLDLTNPDSKLLRRLAIEAPGTYHHSIIVANLAETAAYDIGANTSVSRTGGYYHDIGKLKYPQYFVENMMGPNPHDKMDALDSARVIMSHVKYGLEIAITNKLPKVVQDIIIQHHGTTFLKYFYHKAMETDTDQSFNEDDYRYPYEIPQSKEAAVVMLADTVEAAVRSMIPKGKTMDEVAEFTTRLVRDKLDDGQLRDSTLTIRDLDTVVNSFMRVFRGMYHERIPYPEEKSKMVAEA